MTQTQEIKISFSGKEISGTLTLNYCNDYLSFQSLSISIGKVNAGVPFLRKHLNVEISDFTINISYEYDYVSNADRHSEKTVERSNVKLSYHTSETVDPQFAWFEKEINSNEELKEKILTKVLTLDEVKEMIHKIVDAEQDDFDLDGYIDYLDRAIVHHTMELLRDLINNIDKFEEVEE